MEAFGWRGGVEVGALGVDDPDVGESGVMEDAEGGAELDQALIGEEEDGEGGDWLGVGADFVELAAEVTLFIGVLAGEVEVVIADGVLHGLDGAFEAAAEGGGLLRECDGEMRGGGSERVAVGVDAGACVEGDVDGDAA